MTKAKMGKPFVAHVCKNKACEAIFLDRDEYSAKTMPPKWRYCPDCTTLGYETKKDPKKVELAYNQLKKKPVKQAEVDIELEFLFDEELM